MPSRARKALGASEGETCQYTGEFVRTDSRQDYISGVHTILLKDITDETGQIVTDHQWFNMAKGFEQADLKLGDLVEFRATVKKYIKGYESKWENILYKPTKADYVLSRPTNIRKLDKQYSFLSFPMMHSFCVINYAFLPF
jgi:hypothetical protein